MEVNSGVKNRANASKEVICRGLFTLNTLMLAGVVIMLQGLSLAGFVVVYYLQIIKPL